MVDTTFPSTDTVAIGAPLYWSPWRGWITAGEVRQGDGRRRRCVVLQISGPSGPTRSVFDVLVARAGCDQGFGFDRHVGRCAVAAAAGVEVLAALAIPEFGCAAVSDPRAARTPATRLATGVSLETHGGSGIGSGER